MSSSKLSGKVASIVKSKLETSPQEHINVIISMKKDSDIEEIKKELTQKGLKINTVIEDPVLIIAGTVPVKDISGLAEISDVEKVEYDSGVYAQ